MPSSELEHSLRLTTQSHQVTPAGSFEIIAITAGIGNGWNFTKEALVASLPLWQNVECFIDHAVNNRSIRDLAGICHSPVWSSDHNGILLQLKPIGPSASLLVELAHQVLDTDSLFCPDIGFSADVVFTALGKDVKTILHVHSVDLVIDPARGGVFIRALNQFYSNRNEVPMPLENPNNPRSTPDGVNTTDASPGQLQFPLDPLSDTVSSAALSSSKDAALSPEPAEGSKGAALSSSKGVALGSSKGALSSQIEQDRLAIRSLLDEQSRQLSLADEAQKARAVRAEMCSYLLDSALASARLPRPVSERIRKQFQGSVFEPSTLHEAIEDARSMVSEMTGALSVLGPASAVHSMFSSEDQITAAVFDLIGSPRPNELAALKTSRLSGIRDLYTMMTGDIDFVGGFYPERVRLSTTASLPSILKNAFNKLMIFQWEELGRAGYRWWEPVVETVHFNSLQPITGVLVGEIALLPSVNEGAAYTELSLKDSEETAAWGKYGGYVGLTIEMFERDETHKLQQYPRKLASSALRRISNLVSTIFTDNFGVGPQMTDTYYVFDGDHHFNLGIAGLSGSAFESASKAIYDQQLLMHTSGAANPAKLALDAKYLLVPRSLRLTAMEILYPSFKNEVNIFSENMQRGQMGDVITVPDWVDANDWAAVADPRLAPGIIVAERFGIMPEIFIADSELSGALFTNDEIRMKVRHWISVFVADYRPLFKANVA